MQLRDGTRRDDQKQKRENPCLYRQRRQADQRAQFGYRPQRHLLVAEHARAADHAAIEDRESEKRSRDRGGGLVHPLVLAKTGGMQKPLVPALPQNQDRKSAEKGKS